METELCDHHYYLVPNTLPGTENTYRGVYVGNGSETLDDLAGRISSIAGVSKALVLIVVRALYGKAGEFVSTRLCRVSAGRATFEAAISGSLPSANATLGPDNELYVAIRLADSLRNVAAGVVPGPANPNEVTARLEAVGDSTQSKRITGTEPFYLTGWCLSASGQGEGVAVIDRHGVSHAATIVSDGHGQRITARLETEIPSGTATVVLATRGYFTQDGELHTYEKKVEVAAGETPPTPVVNPPTVTGYEADGMEGEPINLKDGSVNVKGLNLSGAERVLFRYSEDGEPFYTAYPVEATDTLVDCSDLSYDGELERNIGVISVVTPNGESNKFECQFS